MTPKRLLNLIVCLLLACGGLGAVISQAQAENPPKGPSADEQKLSAAYAQHLATSMCGNEYRDKFPRDDRLGPKEKAQFTSHVTSACKCVYDNMASKVSSIQITDYIMYTQSAYENPSKPNREYMGYLSSSDFTVANGAYRGDEIRKKCGFVK